METIIIMIIVITLLFEGGYFVYVSAGISMLMVCLLLGYYVKNKNLVIPIGLTTKATSLIVISYLICSLWAIDSGMAIMGAIKFFPVLLFWLCLNQISEDGKQRVSLYISYFLCAITIITAVMKYMPKFSKYVTVNGGLAGSFQYPNTFAATLMISIVILSSRIKANMRDWLNYVCICACIIGIVLSDSRAMLGIMCLYFALLAILIAHAKIKNSFIFYAFTSILFWCFIIALIYAIRNTSLSTGYGRLLYYKDALRAILHHPFGMGYYGYYFMQGEIQTGVYSVVNVHNELLQIALDVGIFPMVFVIIFVAKYFKSPKNKLLGKVILFFSLLHSLIDYDYQFIVVLFILLLFFNDERKYIIQYNKKNAAISMLLVAVVSTLFIKIGISDFLYVNGKYDKSINWYDSNSIAKLTQLLTDENFEKQLELSDSIIRSNSHVAYAFEVKEREAFSNGQFEDLIINGKKAIMLQPYDINLYEEYISLLNEYAKIYIKNNDLESAAYCLAYMKEVPEMLNGTETKTSFLAWKINDIPELNLQYEYVQMIDNLEKKLQG